MLAGSGTKTPDAQGIARLQRIDAGVVVLFSGAWRVGATTMPTDSLIAEILAQRPAAVALDGTGLSSWDSVLLLCVREIEEACKGRGIRINRDGLPAGARALLSLATKDHGPAAPHGAEPSFLERLGLVAQDVIRSGGDFIGFVGEATVAVAKLAVGRARFRASDLFLVVQDSGAHALGIVSLIAVLIGLIMAFVGAVQLRQFGAEIYVANVVAIATLREMGAVMTAVIMAGRTGAAFAAELGTMQVNEEIDALATLGFQPMEFLVLPRMLALILMMPLLCLYADVLGIFGGGLIGVNMLGLPWVEYWNQTRSAMTMNNLMIGLVKSVVFGIVIALSGCFRGMSSGRSAASVGQATTSAVVMSIVLIVTIDGVFAVILDLLGR